MEVDNYDELFTREAMITMRQEIMKKANCSEGKAADLLNSLTGFTKTLFYIDRLFKELKLMPPRYRKTTRVTLEKYINEMKEADDE